MQKNWENWDFIKTMKHIPVLFEEVLTALDPQPGGIYIDATVNGGGHARALFERAGKKGKVIGIDWDCDLINQLQEQESELKLVCSNYAKIKIVAEEMGVLGRVDGILFDLGFSSYHVDESKRGFSFQKNEPLDMRYNQNENTHTAKEIINTWKGDAIEDAIRKYGEERFAGRIADGIVRARQGGQIGTTAELVDVINGSVPAWYRKGRIHPATRTFQALRIVVNKEFENIEQGLRDAWQVLKVGGRVAVISFHSLEDRIIKNYFRESAKESTCAILTKKPIIASFQEKNKNSRARSAKLRVAQKI